VINSIWVGEHWEADMIFVISGDLNNVEKVESQSFTSLDVWERKHIEEWVRRHPEMLGEDLLVVSTEFDKFVGSKDRPDILAVDREGNLVVVELKRDSIAGYADLQSIRYAAMVSTMTIDQLLPYYADYIKKTTGQNASQEELRTKINNFVELEDFEELSNRPRIILCSEDFAQEITTTVLWLRGFDLDISCVRITPHQLDDKIVLVPEKIIPLKESAEYLTGIQEKEEKRQEAKKRNPLTITTLVSNGLLTEGDRIYLKARLPSYLKYDEENPVYHATITGKLGQSAIRWEKDGKEYSISGLTHKIFTDLHPEKKEPGQLSGNDYWTNEEGISLYELAKRFWEDRRGDSSP
jgi:hypothetical protein